jgi:hypothetical protein
MNTSSSPAISTRTPTPISTTSASTATSTLIATTELQATPVSPTAPTTSNSSSAAKIAVKGGSLPVDPNRVFARVQSILGTDVKPPSSVIVRENSETLLTGSGSRSVPPFWSALGVTWSEPTEPVPVVENGYTTALGYIVLYPGEQPNATSVSWLLAHEYVHYIQFSQGRAATLQRALGGMSTDDRFVSRAVLEGVAVYTTNAYIDRYVPGARPNSALYSEVAAAFPPGSYQRYANSQYIEGVEYIRERFDRPAGADEVYASPPRTSEQVIHELSPEAEPALSLIVTLRTNESAFIPVGRDTMGEAFVRTVLANGVTESQAATAAAGWGADRRVIARTADGDVGYVWALRWDNAADASEFVAAFRAYLEERTVEDDSKIRLTRVSNETVIVLIGDATFVGAATVNGTSGAVTVSLNSTNAS